MSGAPPVNVGAVHARVALALPPLAIKFAGALAGASGLTGADGADQMPSSRPVDSLTALRPWTRNT